MGFAQKYYFMGSAVKYRGNFLVSLMDGILPIICTFEAKQQDP
jgi:hypothetical protein